jgi:hypothetical protein
VYVETCFEEILAMYIDTQGYHKLVKAKEKGYVLGVLLGM